MDRKEELFQAMENLLVADMFQRKALDLVYNAMFVGIELDREEVEHNLGCANAHRASALDYLEGKF